MRFRSFAALLPFVALVVGCSSSDDSGKTAAALQEGERPRPPTELPAGPPPVEKSPAPSPAAANGASCYVEDGTPVPAPVVHVVVPRVACTATEIDSVVSEVQIASDGDVELNLASDIGDECARCIEDQVLSPVDEGGDVDGYACVAALTTQSCAEDLASQNGCFRTHCATCAADRYDACVDESIDHGTCSRVDPACKSAVDAAQAMECFFHDGKDSLGARRRQVRVVAGALCGGAQ